MEPNESKNFDKPRLYHAHADNTLAARLSAIVGITEAQALAKLQADLAD